MAIIVGKLVIFSGNVLFRSSPRPSLPEELLPTLQTFPSTSKKRLCCTPAAIAVAIDVKLKKSDAKKMIILDIFIVLHD